MTLDEVNAAAKALHLTALGGFHEDGKTSILLGPLEPGFWPFMTAQPDFKGNDPLDNWSSAAISSLADNLDAKAVFPFGGPPYHSFIDWALCSGEVWTSPVGLLVHKDAGLLVSYRGALVFDCELPLSSPAASPCDSCTDMPCLTACPVSALSLDGYDVDSCKAHMDVDDTCRSACRVRMSCPVSQSYRRDPAQTAFHMEAFHPS